VNNSGDQPLTGQTILIAQRDAVSDLTRSLERAGARVVTWPKVQICEPESFAALDEAIDNLFGYDWIVFRNVHAVEFFLQRLKTLGHVVTSLDALRIVAIDDRTSEKLSSSNVHVDVVVSGNTDQDVLTELENYLGGREAIGQTNLLNFRAANSAETLSLKLEELGARVDTVNAYRTVPDNSIVALKVLLKGGSIDCVAFQEVGDLEELADLFDTGDLRTLLAGAIIACTSEAVGHEAGRFSLDPHIFSSEERIESIANAIAIALSKRAGNL
jgi:uroporphyrinogen III methyltransferase/synthase